ncbi:MAG: asparagine synthase-related protein, partial [Terriglobales bacterium]
ALVQLMFSLPGEVVYQSGSRGIHRDAMKGILPEKVRLRRSKANFDDPARRGAADDLRTLWTTLPSGGAARMGYLASEARLTEALTSLRELLPASTGAGASWLTSDLIALESWLSTFFAGETAASTV